jgi:hypothetical protein
MSERLRRIAALAAVTCGAAFVALIETAPRLRNG